MKKPAFLKIFPKYYITIQKNCKDEEEIKKKQNFHTTMKILWYYY